MALRSFDDKREISGRARRRSDEAGSNGKIFLRASALDRNQSCELGPKAQRRAAYRFLIGRQERHLDGYGLRRRWQDFKRCKRASRIVIDDEHPKTSKFDDSGCEKKKSN